MRVFTPEGMAPDEGAVAQLERCLQDERAVDGALMADHHLGYSMPIGGVIAYKDAISPSGVGFDIACGNKAVRTELQFDKGWDLAVSILIGDIRKCMEEVQRKVAFGIGRTSGENVDHQLFDSNLWTDIEKDFPGLKEKARQQLGTVGSGNHYVDLLVDEEGFIWVANHFGSRGFGHTIASGIMAKAVGANFTDRVPETEDPCVLDIESNLGTYYMMLMRLAGEYAYAGRDYVINQVLEINGNPTVTMEVHNHHNFAWLENDLWVVRKGATPLTSEPAFIGGSMGDISVIVRGVEGMTRTSNAPFSLVQEIGALGSAPHGAGRVMSRTAAAGKLRKMWYCPNRNCCFVPERSTGDKTGYQNNHCPNCGIPLKRTRMRDVSTAAINWNEARSELNQRGITVLGAGADESPGVYKPLKDVIAAHGNIEVLHTLSPIGVVMAGANEFDPYKD